MLSSSQKSVEVLKSRENFFTLAWLGGTRSRGQGLASREAGPLPPRPRCRDTRRRGACGGFRPADPGKLRQGGRGGAFVGRPGAPGGGLAEPADLPPAAPAQVRNPESPPSLRTCYLALEMLMRSNKTNAISPIFSYSQACRRAKARTCPLSRPAKARPLGRTQEPQRKHS